MEINKNSWHSKFYYVSYRELPQSLCEYFWKLVLALTLLPLTWAGYAIKSSREQIYGVKINTGLIFWMLFWFVPYMVSIGNNTSFLQSLILSIGGYIFLTVVTLITILIIYLISKSKKPNIVTERWKAFKGKYCPQITWL